MAASRKSFNCRDGFCGAFDCETCRPGFTEQEEKCVACEEGGELVKGLCATCRREIIDDREEDDSE